MFLYVIFLILILIFFRDEKILSKILRIIKIWRERHVYNHSYLADLTGLLSTKNHEFKFADPVQGCQVRTVL